MKYDNINDVTAKMAFLNIKLASLIRLSLNLKNLLEYPMGFDLRDMIEIELSNVERDMKSLEFDLKEHKKLNVQELSKQ